MAYLRVFTGGDPPSQVYVHPPMRGDYVGTISSLERKKPAVTRQAFEAEGTRFELVVQNNPYGSLANCWFQPLTHPSGLKALKLRLTDGNAKIR